jgi:hypothetical protein
MSDTVTVTIACIGKNLLNNQKLSIGVVISPMLSDTVAYVSKTFAYTYDEGTVARDVLTRFFLIGLLSLESRFRG